jgi:hypothetical protein
MVPEPTYQSSNAEPRCRVSPWESLRMSIPPLLITGEIRIEHSESQRDYTAHHPDWPGSTMQPSWSTLMLIGSAVVDKVSCLREDVTSFADKNVMEGLINEHGIMVIGWFNGWRPLDKMQQPWQAYLVCLLQHSRSNNPLIPSTLPLLVLRTCKHAITIHTGKPHTSVICVSTTNCSL